MEPSITRWLEELFGGEPIEGEEWVPPDRDEPDSETGAWVSIVGQAQGGYAYGMYMPGRDHLQVITSSVSGLDFTPWVFWAFMNKVNSEPPRLYRGRDKGVEVLAVRLQVTLPDGSTGHFAFMRGRKGEWSWGKAMMDARR